MGVGSRPYQADEHDHIATFRLTVRRQAGVGEWDVRAVDRLVDEEPVSDQQRRDHAAGRNAIRLDDERPEYEEDRQRPENRFEILPHVSQPGALRNGARLLSAPSCFR